MRKALIDCMSFDWSKISPAMFGAVFQGLMGKNQRRSFGVHYTSEQNILKLINPLIMNELWAEFERVKTDPSGLDHLHHRISRLVFLDPACGCGNFLIITYRQLRTLETAILKHRLLGLRQGFFDISTFLRVNVEQFYGIELEDFPCQIAQVGMWLMDHQMNLVVSNHFGRYFARLPLSQSATIVKGNALQMDWQSVIPNRKISYIFGNPPFVGKKEQSKQQKDDLNSVFGNQKGVSNLDYVCAWFKKAADASYGTTRCAFVSTNSISQGEQPAILWKALADKVKIDFAYRTFKWSNAARGKAAVHCVIIGFSPYSITSKPVIIDGITATDAHNINGYLIEGPNVLIESRSRPLCDVPKMQYGSMPIDNGALILSKEDFEKLSKSEPDSLRFVHRYVGGDELLNNIPRYCLWLKDIQPHQITESEFITSRIDSCRKFRMASNRPSTKSLASTPHIFGEIRHPDTDMLVIPKISSENRPYLPIRFLSKDVIVSGSAMVIPSATMFHFGILSSSIHNCWMRAVCGRLESRYQYSSTVVYNNFPWPEVASTGTVAIESAAWAVMQARDLYNNATLAELYDPISMPRELLIAHEQLDRTVMSQYGIDYNSTETQCVEMLMNRYTKLVE